MRNLPSQFDETIITLKELLDKYWLIVDHSERSAGADIGSQYRTGIYYMNEDLPIIRNSVRKSNKSTKSL